MGNWDNLSGVNGVIGIKYLPECLTQRKPSEMLVIGNGRFDGADRGSRKVGLQCECLEPGKSPVRENWTIPFQDLFLPPKLYVKGN